VSCKHIDAYISVYRWPSKDLKQFWKAHIMPIKINERLYECWIGCMSAGEVEQVVNI
jgi:hypothetical protein